MGLADNWVKTGFALASDPHATFQQAVGALRDQSDVSRALMYTEIICGAANLGLMVMAASSTCFVAGTPVVVGIEPANPVFKQPSENEAATHRIAADGVTIIDVIGGLALVGAVTLQQRRKRKQTLIASTDYDTDDFSWMHATSEPDWPEINDLQAPTVDEDLLECLAGEQCEQQAITLEKCSQTSAATPRTPLANRGTGGEGPACNETSQNTEMNFNPESSQPKKRIERPLIGLIGCLLLAVACLAPRLASIASSTPAVASSTHDSVTESVPPRLVTKPIEEIRCGDRIPSELPEGLLPEDEAEPDPATWRLVELTVEKQDGTIVEVKLLRPLAWLEQAGAIRNGHFDLAVEELDIEGRAAVLDIKPCPPIQGGEGQVVTGTFRHTSDDLVALHIQGEPEPIVCTSGHPVWNEIENEFVCAADLIAASYVRPLKDDLGSVISSKLCRKQAEVYNVEISQTHVYHVGNTGILVHNAVANCEKWAKKNVKKNGGETAKVDGVNASSVPVPMRDSSGNIVNELGPNDEPFRMHTVVLRDGVVFDQNFPDGVPKSLWKDWVNTLAKDLGAVMEFSHNLND